MGAAYIKVRFSIRFESNLKLLVLYIKKNCLFADAEFDDCIIDEVKAFLLPGQLES